MAVTLGNNTITFPDGTQQSAAYTAGSDRGQLISVTTYSSAGTSTYTVPSNCRFVYVKLVGGGGGSAGYNESGGAGGYAEGRFDVTPGANVTVTVGGAGTGVTYYAAGVRGGTSSFGSYLSATGGYGANQNANHTGGAGGLGSGGGVNLYGGGGIGHANHHSHYGTGGKGGGASFYGSGQGCRHYHNTFIPYGSPGAGAPGGVTDNVAGSGTPYGTTANPGLVQVYAYS